MTNYLIYRHGSNAANQSLTNKLAIDIVEAHNQSEACEIAATRNDCYVNQFFSAVCESRANKEDWNCVCEEQAIQEQLR